MHQRVAPQHSASASLPCTFHLACQLHSSRGSDNDQSDSDTERALRCRVSNGARIIEPAETTYLCISNRHCWGCAANLTAAAGLCASAAAAPREATAAMAVRTRRPTQRTLSPRHRVAGAPSTVFAECNLESRGAEEGKRNTLQSAACMHACERQQMRWSYSPQTRFVLQSAPLQHR